MEDRRWGQRIIYHLEKEIYELEEVLSLRLEAMDGGRGDVAEEIRRIRRELVNPQEERFTGALTPWQTIQVSRHTNRPLLMDYVDLIFDDFVELHGDRAIGDDRAIRCGFAAAWRLSRHLDRPSEGADAQGKAGMFLLAALHPEGYRKALKNMQPCGEVPTTSGLFNRHTGRLSGNRAQSGAAAKAATDCGGKPVGDVAFGDARRVRGDW